jgi:outer membrane protein
LKKRLIALLLVPGCAFAQDPPHPLSLAQAESLALRHAPALGAAYFSAQAANQVVREARSRFFPQITGVIDAVGTGNAIQNAFSGASHTASQNIRIGASGSLNNPTILSRQSNGLTASQLIFDFGRTANLTAASQSQALSQAQRAQVTRAQVVLRVDQAYLNALRAQALLRVADQAVAARQYVFADVSALAQAKLKSDLDVAVARGNLQQAQQLLLQAQSAVGAAFAELSAALGYKRSFSFQLTEPPQAPLPNESADALAGLALQIRPEIAALRDETQGAQKQALAERDARLPRIQALGAIGRTTVGDPGVTGNYAALGIDVEVPVFTGGLLSSREEEAKLRAAAAQKALEDEENQVVRNVHAAWLDASTALRNVEVANQLAASSQQALNLAQAQYQTGQTSIIEFSQAQLALTQAQIGAATAKYDYQIARATLEYQVGKTQYAVPAPKANLRKGGEGK